jgi:hypothetical protein
MKRRTGCDALKNLDVLLNAVDPWVVYRTYLDLMDVSENDDRVMKAKKRMLEHPLILGLVQEMQQWPGTVISSHKSAGQLYHKLTFLADLGITKEDVEISNVVHTMMNHQSVEGLFQLSTNIPVHFGGTGQDLWAWALCDAPLQLYAVKKMKLMEDVEIQRGMDYLISLARENGWPCTVSKELGKFRGPGRKDDPCPYVNLIMLKLLAQFDALKNSKEAQSGVESLLHLWETSQEQHPYMFFMGSDFRKLKAPFVWYDLLHVVEVLSYFEKAVKDPRFLEMVALIHSKANAEGLYTPESVWTVWKGCEFAQKKIPSAWLTFLIYRMDKRIGQW